MSRYNSGQTIIALLIFMMLAIALTLSATAVVIINIQGDTSFRNGETALQDAQTGAENALLQLERNNSYSGETMTLAQGTATITVSGTTTKTIISKGTSGNFVRTITVTATITNTVLALTSWSETP